MQIQNLIRVIIVENIYLCRHNYSKFKPTLCLVCREKKEKEMGMGMGMKMEYFTRILQL